MTDAKPTVSIPSETPPADLVIDDLTVGEPERAVVHGLRALAGRAHPRAAWTGRGAMGREGRFVEANEPRPVARTSRHGPCPTTIPLPMADAARPAHFAGSPLVAVFSLGLAMMPVRVYAKYAPSM